MAGPFRARGTGTSEPVKEPQLPSVPSLRPGKKHSPYDDKEREKNDSDCVSSLGNGVKNLPDAERKAVLMITHSALLNSDCADPVVPAIYNCQMKINGSAYKCHL